MTPGIRSWRVSNRDQLSCRLSRCITTVLWLIVNCVVIIDCEAAGEGFRTEVLSHILHAKLALNIIGNVVFMCLCNFLSPNYELIGFRTTSLFIFM